jgi:antitoxin VapB
VAINIKNAETEQLARELAELTGESMTSAITAAVRDRLEKIRTAEGVDLAERLVRIGKDCAKHLKEPFRTIDHGELLYDEKGLPR